MHGDIFLCISTPKLYECMYIWHSSAVVAYIEAVRNVACKILELIAEGLWVTDRTVFSRLIKNPESDSMLRLNHYFPNYTNCKCNMVGIGEHSDPQILTLLRSNDVPGLQISSREDASGWISVVPDPRALCVNVGDTLQARIKISLICRYIYKSEDPTSMLNFIFYKYS